MKYRLGEIVTLEIIEALPEGRYIVSIDGKLIRTKPFLAYTPKPNEFIRAKVTSINPLGFQAITNLRIGLNRNV